MSVAAILALADKANAVEPSEAASHVRVPFDVLIEAARQIRERESRVHECSAGRFLDRLAQRENGFVTYSQTTREVRARSTRYSP